VRRLCQCLRRSKPLVWLTFRRLRFASPNASQRTCCVRLWRPRVRIPGHSCRTALALAGIWWSGGSAVPAYRRGADQAAVHLGSHTFRERNRLLFGTGSACVPARMESAFGPRRPCRSRGICGSGHWGVCSNGRTRGARGQTLHHTLRGNVREMSPNDTTISQLTRSRPDSLWFSLAPAYRLGKIRAASRARAVGPRNEQGI